MNMFISWVYQKKEKRKKKRLNNWVSLHNEKKRKEKKIKEKA